MQVIRSLDEMVTDIEHKGTSMTDRHPCIADSVVADGADRAVLHRFQQQQQQQQQQQHLQLMPDVVADVSRQLSEKFDLHDSFVGLKSM